MSHYCPENSSNHSDLSSADRRTATTEAALKKLYLAIALCSVFMIVETFGGIMANSLAIITDAVHLLSDIAGFFTSVMAIIVARRMASTTYTFGFQRAQTLGAFASVAFVWILTVYLIIEAIDRIYNPVEINGKWMFFIALFGIFVNIILAIALQHQHSPSHTHTLSDRHHGQSSPFSPINSQIVEISEVEKLNLPMSSAFSSITEHTEANKVENINLRAAFIHVLGDLIQSIGVLIASSLIWYNEEWRIADPICTLLFSVMVFGSTVMISKEIIHILMEGTPKNINASNVKIDIESIEGIESAHDLHIWTLSPGNVALTVHIITKPTIAYEEHGLILSKIQEIICSKYNIHHSTIQIEQNESFHCNPNTCVSE